MKKLSLWGWHSTSQIKAITASNHNIVKWFSNAGNSKYHLNNLIHQPYELQVQAATIPDILLEVIDKNFTKFSEMYSRVTYSRGLTTQELLHIFNLYMRYFYADLEKYKPDYVLFSTFPHFGTDYALYLCAKALNIKVIITFQTLFSNRFFAIESLEDFEDVHQKKQYSQNNQTIKQSFKKDLFYMNKINNKKKKCSLSLIGESLKLLTKQSKPLTFTGMIQKFQECQAFNKLFFKNTVNKIDIKNKYVYFPLQLQPEMTTSMLGGIYSDQLLALEQLSSLLPNDWQIYVKENPKQTPRQRGKFFFKRLKSIPKVQYLSSSINTHYLIEHSQFVSVVTGTAGWEAISGGKNVLVFGKAWYSSLTGVFQYHENLNIEKLLSFKIKHQELEEKFNHLLNTAHEGVIDPSYNQLVPDYSEDKNQLLLLKFLKEQSGKHFDPKLIDIFFDNLGEFLKIRNKFKEIF
jgi:hypothetical protein